MSDFKWTWYPRAITIWWPWEAAPITYVPKTRKGDEERISRTLDHEGVHVNQWLDLGRVRFLWRYFADLILALAVVALAWLVSWWLLPLALIPLFVPWTKHGRIDLEAPAFASSVQWRLSRGQTSLKSTAFFVTIYETPLEHYSRILSRSFRSYYVGPFIKRDDVQAQIASYLLPPPCYATSSTTGRWA